MAGNQRLTFAEEYGGVAMVLSLNLQYGGRWQIPERNTAFDFRLDDVGVYFVTQIGMRYEHGSQHPTLFGRSYQRMAHAGHYFGQRPEDNLIAVSGVALDTGTPLGWN